MFWLEPLVEVETPAGRFAYGPVTPDDVDAPVRCRSSGAAATHPLASAPTEKIPFLDEPDSG